MTRSAIRLVIRAHPGSAHDQPGRLGEIPMVVVTADNGAAMVECGGGGLWRRTRGNIDGASRVIITPESPGKDS